ncbi:uncharacterized protein LOC107363348 [Tetranychus urticae]|uniref:Methyltransferase type 11 domain-containing protein n=1 Tax=Tetranychus urticae TaxID=32264 RepID=T1KCQ5_TETUR|nr:uncharacterized protein LOC107363348 [Tetranychus urticae]
MAEKKLSDEFKAIEQKWKPMPIEESIKMYESWSDKYDSDMDVWQYDSPKGTAVRFSELNLPKDINILDCGAGTGLLAIYLKQFGYQNIDALDGCEKMLEKAREKNLYSRYFVSFVGPTIQLPFLSDTYDALVMCGVFTPGHFPVQVGTFEQLLRVVKKGGILSWGMADPEHYADRDPAYANDGFNKLIEQLKSKNLIEVVKDHPKELPSVQPKKRYFWAVRKL